MNAPLDDLRPQIETILTTLGALSKMDGDAYIKALDRIISRLMKHRKDALEKMGTMPRTESIH